MDQDQNEETDTLPQDGDDAPEAQGTEAGAAKAASEELKPEDRIAQLEAQVADLNDQYLRKAADFENFRKRMNQEKQSAIDFANQGLLLDLIPIIDDFERAIKAAESVAGSTETVSKDFTALYEGISMTEKRFLSQLENRWGLKRFDSAGEVFDPNRHEAIMMEKSADIAEPVVQADLIKGYTLKDRVVRAAKVKVLMPEGGSNQGVSADSEVNTTEKAQSDASENGNSAK
ncbi:protein GrpE [Spirochaetia bacterium]|nr:protein GrpE [Spirochaetia bacterium]